MVASRYSNQGKPILDSRGQPISAERLAQGTNLIAARNFRGGLPDADPNLSFIPMDRRGVAGLSGTYQEMMQTLPVIASAVSWAITEGAALPKEIVWQHSNEPDNDADAFMKLCTTATLDEAVVYDSMIEGQAALWAAPLLDSFMGFGLMTPRLMQGGAVEWYPVAHNAVMLWKPNGYLLGGVRFSTPNGYDEVGADDLVHTVYGNAGAGEFEGRSPLRSCVQAFNMIKGIALQAGIYQQLTSGFLDISYQPSVSEDDVAAFNTYAQQFQDGQRKYIVRPKNVDVEFTFPSGTAPDVIAQIEYWDRQIEKQLNAALSGIANFGSRAMAETIDDAAGRKAKAWLNNIYDRASRGMFQWLARQYGYTGKLPRLQVQAAEMTTGITGWSAYVQGVQAGLLTKGPQDEAWGRKVIGAPELEIETQVSEDAPAPLLVGSLQVAQQVLQSLKVTPANPIALAPEAAKLLLVAAGLNENAAAAMVDAQLRQPDAAPPVEAVAPAATPAVDTTAPDATPEATAPSSEVAAADAPVEAAPAAKPAADDSQMKIGNGKIEVPKAIGSAPAFAPVGKSADAAEALLMIVGNLADIDPSIIPEAVSKAAEAALASSKGKSTDLEGMLAAKELAAGKPLAWPRVMRLAEWHGRARQQPDLKRGLGYALRGADAGAAWVADLLTAYVSGAHNRTARLHDAGNCCGNNLADADADAEGVVVIGADGKKFKTFRPLRPEEKIVAWVTLAETRADLDAMLATELAAVADKHRQAVKAALANGWQAGERETVWAEYVRQYQAVLTQAAGALRESVSSEVTAEAKRALKGGAVNTASAQQQATAVEVMTTQADGAFARAAALTQQAGEVIADRVQGEISSAILGGADMATWSSRITEKGLANSALEGRNIIEAATRQATYATAPEAVGLVPTTVIRTAILDGNACQHCKDSDGQKYKVSEWVNNNQLALPELPDPECAGGVGRCRCGWFAIWEN